MRAKDEGPVVILGAGQGGLQAAASLRQAGYAGPVTLIGEEPGLPYQRPPLSKAYMLGGSAEQLSLRAEGFFDSQRIRLLTGVRGTGIDRERGVVTTDSGDHDYAHLILATGAANLHPPIDGLEHCVELRTFSDARRLRALTSGRKRFAVIGGGFIGLEFAAIMRRLGHEAIVAEATPRLMGRAVSPQMSGFFLKRHIEMGSRILLDSAVGAVTEHGIRLARGEEIEADVVLLAAGVRPNTGLAKAAGLDCKNGVRVDDQLVTSDPQISALGDCACFPESRRRLWVRLESVQAATDHARYIAARLCGKAPAPYSALPWFWSDQGDLKLQIAGLALPEDRSERVGTGEIVFRFDESDRLTAVETVNVPKVHMKGRKLLAAGGEVTRSMAMGLLD